MMVHVHPNNRRNNDHNHHNNLDNYNHHNKTSKILCIYKHVSSSLSIFVHLFFQELSSIFAFFFDVKFACVFTRDSDFINDILQYGTCLQYLFDAIGFDDRMSPVLFNTHRPWNPDATVTFCAIELDAHLYLFDVALVDFWWFDDIGRKGELEQQADQPWKGIRHWVW